MCYHDHDNLRQVFHCVEFSMWKVIFRPKSLDIHSIKELGRKSGKTFLFDVNSTFLQPEHLTNQKVANSTFSILRETRRLPLEKGRNVTIPSRY